MTVDDPREAVAPVLTRPALLYLFADGGLPRARLIRRLGGRPAVPAGASGCPVRLDQLEEWLLAWALWDLQEAGVVELTITGPPSRLHGGKLTVAATDTPVERSDTLSGVVASYVSPEPRPARLVIGDWATETGPLGLDAVVGPVWAELAASELETVTTRPRRWQRSAWNRVLPSVRATVGDDLEREWAQMALAWHSLPGEFTQSLRNECRDGLETVRPMYAVNGPAVFGGG